MTEECKVKTEIVALSTRLETLMGNVNFRPEYDRVHDSPEQLLAVGKLNLREYEKIEGMDEERQERIWNLISTILATVLQEEAIDKYGNTDGSSIRLVLYGWFNQAKNREYCDRLMQTAKLALLNFGLTEEHLQYVIKCLDKLPEVIIDVLAKETGHLRLLPRSNAHSIAIALADIVKEAGSFDQ